MRPSSPLLLSSPFSQLFARSAHGPFQPVCYVPGYAHIITPVYTRKFSSTRGSDNHFCRAADGLLRRADRRGAARNEPRFPRDCIYLPANAHESIHTPLVPPRFPSPFARNVALLPGFLAASLFHGRSQPPRRSIRWNNRE